MPDEDPKLLELYAQQRAAEIGIRIRRGEIARERGEAVSKVEELTCEEHPGTKFIVVDRIKSPYILFERESGKTHLDIYECEKCNEDKEKLDVQKSRAHDCPNCGIVKGEVVKIPHRSSEESWRALAGREGEHYHCRTCWNQLGEHYWKFS